MSYVITIVNCLVLLILFGVSSNPTYAASKKFRDVMSETLPTGLDNVDDLFIIPSNIPGIKNSAGLVNSSIYNSSQANVKVVKISTINSGTSFGAVWSNSDASAEIPNYVDISKKQTMSMWLYTGDSTNSGDGMAFVLQNSGTNAFATVDGTNGAGGQTMGVWGGFSSTNIPSASTIASRAIQKSWALEFDTYFNRNEAADSNYDAGLDKPGFPNGNHIASGYPAQASTYDTTTTPGPILNHQSPITSVNGSTRFLTDGKWHHLTISWRPAVDGKNPTVTYDFDDKNMDGTINTNDEKKTVSVDPTAFDLKNGNTDLTWGFTGSTGTAEENNLIIFESIPALVEAEAKATIIDNSQNDREFDATDTTENIAHNGDKLTVEYDLGYVSGKQGWKNIISNIDLPTNIDYDSSSAKVVYDDGTSDTVDLSNLSSNKLTKTLKDLGPDSPKKAVLSISGTANGNATGDTVVAGAHSRFEGTNSIQDATTPEFTIKQNKKISLTALGELNQQLTSNENATVGGTVKYDPVSTIDPANIKFHISVNGGEYNAFDMDKFENGSDSFKSMIPADELQQGDNTVSIYVTDEEYNQSNTITYNFTVSGSLQIVAAKESSFKTIHNYSTRQKYIQRSDDWALELDDTRREGSVWSLRAQATPLKNESNDTWDGSLVYVDNKTGAEQALDADQQVQIATGIKGDQETEQNMISQNWESDGGVLLKQNGFNQAGHYSTKVTWTATDSII